MKINRKKLCTVGKAAAAGLAYYLFIRLTGYAIPCPVHKATHGRILCPGCGITRMLLSVIKFDLEAAFRYNAAIFCLSPLWLAGGILWLTDSGKRGRSVIVWFSLAVLILFCILRNIPSVPIY